MDIKNNPTHYPAKPPVVSQSSQLHNSPYVQNHIAGLNKQHFKQSLTWLKQEYTRLHTNKLLEDANQDPESEDLPTWMQNRKLLVRVFIVWIMLAGYMLFSVFSHNNF